MKTTASMCPEQKTDYVVRVGIIPMYTGNSAYQAHCEATAYALATVTFRNDEASSVYQYAERD